MGRAAAFARLCCTVFVAFAATIAPAAAQTTVPLPPNYQTVIDNPTVLVQRVHYGPHEFLPAHDHYPVVTVLVYLNDSGVVEIAHDPKPGDTEPDVLKRPPTHTGAFRIGPAAFERHSVRNLSDLPSDFLRVELKSLPLDWIKDQVRGPAPTPPLRPGIATEYTDARLRIDRIVCAAVAPCVVPADAPSVLIAIPTAAHPLDETSLVRWTPAKTPLTLPAQPDTTQYLRILLPQP